MQWRGQIGAEFVVDVSRTWEGRVQDSGVYVSDCERPGGSELGLWRP